MENNKISKNFKFLVLNNTPGYFLNGFISVIFIWIVLTITNSPFYASLIGVIGFLPHTLSIFYGNYIDKVNKKKRLEILLYFLRIIIFISILMVFLTGNRIYEIIYLFIAVVIMAALSALSAIIKSTWEKDFMKNNYQKNVSILNTLSSILNLSGYILAGILIYIDVYYSIFVMIIVSIISLIPLFFIKPEYEKINNKKHLFFDGLHYIKKHILLYKTIRIEMIDYVAGGAILSVMEVLIKFNYYASALLLTVLLVFDFGGGATGSFFGGKVKGNSRNLFLLGESISVVLLLLIPFIILYSSFVYLLLAFFIISFFGSITDNIVHTMIYKETEAEYMPKVAGSITTLLVIPAFFSGILMGLVMQYISVYAAFYAMAIISFIVIILLLNFKELNNFKMGEN